MIFDIKTGLSSSLGSTASDDMPMATSEMQKCIEHCLACHNACEQLIIHCLMKGGSHAEASHIRILMDCSQICRVSADFMLRGSDLHSKTCGICAQICAACAQDCRLRDQDHVMQNVARLCDLCAESCHQMSDLH